jgi:hypothetical protein
MFTKCKSHLSFLTSYDSVVFSGQHNERFKLAVSLETKDSSSKNEGDGEGRLRIFH